MLLLAIVTALTSVVIGAVHPSGADQISDAKTQAAQIEAEIQAEGAHIDGLSQAYDAATYHLQQVDAGIATTESQLSADQSQVGRDQSQLRTQAIKAYMTDGTTNQFTQMFSSNHDETGIRDEYDAIATGNVTTTVDQLHTAQTQLQAQQSALRQQQAEAAADQASIASSREEAQSAEAAEQSTLSKVNANINALIQQQEAAQAAAAAAAFNQKVAAQRAAAAQAAALASQSTRTDGGGGGDVSTGPAPGTDIPPPGSGAGAAIAAAESQIGVPYVWGAEDPGVGFDCSGLVAWAWGQAGHPLPHYSGAQYDDTTHIPLSDIAPGDLLFYGPGGDEHVAMYVGGGQMIEAPETGETVHITGVRTDGLAGVGRVE